MRITVTGASGYVGRAVQGALLERGHEVIAVSRHGAAVEGAHGVAADVLRDPLRPLLVGQDAVIHLVGIIREDPSKGVTFPALHVTATERVLEACLAEGVSRYVHMSALGAAGSGVSRYFETKRRAEEVVRRLMPDAVIVRPSLVFGGGAEFFRTLANLARNPVVPVPGDGHTRFDPVFRGDLATALAAMAEDPEAAGATFEIGGPKRMTLDEMIDWVARLNGRPVPVPKMHVPTALMRPLVGIGERWRGFPVTTDQLAMLNVDNITDDRRWQRWVPTPTPPGHDV
jgi:uncharacterized protein YbjT (DUF2867 family)